MRKAEVRLEGSMLNSKRTCSILREFHLAQHVCLVRSIAATETTQKLLKRVIGALRKAIRLEVSTRRHVKLRFNASPKRLTEATGELRVAITNQHSGQCV
jgi:hypothetical protein